MEDGATVGVIDKFIEDLTMAESKQDILATLTHIAHHFDHDDEELHNLEIEAVSALAESLHHAMTLTTKRGRRYYRCNVFENGNSAIRISVFCCALEMVLRCSKSVAETCCSQVLKADLLPVLPKVVEIFLRWDGDETVRQVTLSTCTTIIRRLGYHWPYSKERLLYPLLAILNGHVPSDIRVDASCAIAGFAHDDSDISSFLMMNIEEHASLLISTLSTAAVAASSQEQLDDAVSGLMTFCANSYLFRVKMTKRRCTVMAIIRILSSSKDLGTRKNALELCNSLLSCKEMCLSSGSSVGGLLEGNGEIVAKGLMACAKIEPDLDLQKRAIWQLAGLLSNSKLSPSLQIMAMEALQAIAFDGVLDDGSTAEPSAVEAAVAYARSSVSLWHDEVILDTVVEFVAFPFARVRKEALVAIQLIALNPQAASMLLRDTDVLENLSLIIQHGSMPDCESAMHLLKQFVDNTSLQRTICCHSNLLGSLVHFVTDETIRHRTAHLCGVESLLSLLTANSSGFLAHAGVLPWLVNFANTTTADGTLKKLAISAIVRLSSALLNREEEKDP